MSFRFRNIYIVLGLVLLALAWTLTDPDVHLVENLPYAAPLVSMIVILLKIVPYVGMLHLSRKALLDYVDLQQLFLKAIETPTGAGLVVVGIGLIMISISMVIYAATSQ